jgi:hypothetical protein
MFDPDRILQAAEDEIVATEYRTACLEPPWEGDIRLLAVRPHANSP